MQRSCFPTCCFRSRPWAWACATSPDRKLDWYLRSIARIWRGCRRGAAVAQHMEFQAEAIRLLRPRLGPERALIGFVGGPFTLYAYAVAGSHEGFARTGLQGLEDGLYAGFCERLIDLLAANMVLQARAGADCVALFDTAAGTLDPAQFARHAVAPLAQVLARFRAACPHTPLIYYSRDTGPDHWRALEPLPLQCLGIDWRHDLADDAARADAALVRAGQSSIRNGCCCRRSSSKSRVRKVFTRLPQLPAAMRAAWVCGLGHGVLQHTPEDNVQAGAEDPARDVLVSGGRQPNGLTIAMIRIGTISSSAASLNRRSIVPLGSAALPRRRCTNTRQAR